MSEFVNGVPDIPPSPLHLPFGAPWRRVCPGSDSHDHDQDPLNHSGVGEGREGPPVVKIAVINGHLRPKGSDARSILGSNSSALARSAYACVRVGN